MIFHLFLARFADKARDRSLLPSISAAFGPPSARCLDEFNIFNRNVPFSHLNGKKRHHSQLLKKPFEGQPAPHFTEQFTKVAWKQESLSSHHINSATWRHYPFFTPHPHPSYPLVHSFICSIPRRPQFLLKYKLPINLPMIMLYTLSTFLTRTRKFFILCLDDGVLVPTPESPDLLILRFSVQCTIASTIGKGEGDDMVSSYSPSKGLLVQPFKKKSIHCQNTCLTPFSRPQCSTSLPPFPSHSSSYALRTGGDGGVANIDCIHAKSREENEKVKQKTWIDDVWWWQGNMWCVEFNLLDFDLALPETEACRAGKTPNIHLLQINRTRIHGLNSALPWNSIYQQVAHFSSFSVRPYKIRWLQ